MKSIKSIHNSRTDPLLFRPTTIEAGMRIKGVGEAKAAQYLEKFIEVINSYR